MKKKQTKILSESLILFLFFFQSHTFAEDPPDTVWTRTYGGTNIDIGHSLEQTSDGGFIITGYTRSFGTLSGRNIWLVKTDSNGTMQWNNTYGGNEDEEAYSVLQSSDGGYLLCGYTKSFGAGLNDVVLVKTNSAGDQIWLKTFGGPNDDEGFSVIETSDYGYLIAGVTSSYGAGSRDGWLIKTDSSGNELWRRTLGGLSSDGARSVQQTSDGGYIITGWTFSSGPGAIGNAWLVKTDSSGIQEWSKAFGGTNADRGYSVLQTADNGYIITGYTASSGAGLDDMLLIKTDPAGNAVWTKTFGGTGRDYGHFIQPTSDGGFIITGYTLSFGAGGDDLWLVKTDGSGNLLWDKTYGGTASDVGYCVRQTSEGGFVITGHTLSFGAGVHDMWLIKLAPVVPVELLSFSGTTSGRNAHLNWITASETNNRGFEILRQDKKQSHPDFWVLAGFVEGYGTTAETKVYSFTDENILPGNYHYKLKQIDFDGSFEYSDVVEISGEPGEYFLSQNYPNPFNPVTKMEYSVPQAGYVLIRLYDILGNEVRTLINGEKSAGSYVLTLDAEELPSSVYFCTMQAGSYYETRKLILLK